MGKTKDKKNKISEKYRNQLETVKSVPRNWKRVSNFFYEIYTASLLKVPPTDVERIMTETNVQTLLMHFLSDIKAQGTSRSNYVL